MSDRQTLLNELVVSLGERIEVVGAQIKDDLWIGIAQKLEDLRQTIAAIEAAEKMRRI